MAGFCRLKSTARHLADPHGLRSLVSAGTNAAVDAEKPCLHFVIDMTCGTEKMSCDNKRRRLANARCARLAAGVRFRTSVFRRLADSRTPGAACRALSTCAAPLDTY